MEVSSWENQQFSMAMLNNQRVYQIPSGVIKRGNGKRSINEDLNDVQWKKHRHMVNVQLPRSMTGR